MIRDKRLYIAVNAVGAASAAFALVIWTAFPSRHSLFPQWFLVGDALLLLGFFIYNVVRRMRGPIEPTGWARNLTDKQIWTVKGVVMSVLAVVALCIIFYAVPRH
ncbi:MAG TPA: hypothetical protein VHT92_11255 [Candidatus Cybelea sp.]|jgi:hypothetical protein|nr:hypothetical protein [Candidatus Cybelea sp.]